jgi:hypothetical protein
MKCESNKAGKNLRESDQITGNLPKRNSNL